MWLNAHAPKPMPVDMPNTLHQQATTAFARKMHRVSVCEVPTVDVAAHAISTTMRRAELCQTWDAHLPYQVGVVCDSIPHSFTDHDLIGACLSGRQYCFHGWRTSFVSRCAWVHMIHRLVVPARCSRSIVGSE